MNPAIQLKSTSVASHSCTFKAFLSITLLIITASNSIAQDSTTIINNNRNLIISDSTNSKISATQTISNQYPLTKLQIKRRIRTIAAANIIGYGAAMYGLNAAWYANYPRSSFHTFNDNMEWLQVDKVGHMYSAYMESRISMELWRWTGIERKKRIWLGGLSGAFYQTVIETLDGFSSEWGWSWGDFAANIVGSATLISQELAWNDQRIKIKFSAHKNNYSDPVLRARANDLYGKNFSESFLKDYNAQTYWASVNIRSFFPESKIPAWLSIAVGYGANGMFGASSNIASDSTGIIFYRPDIKRYRQWYLSPDIDLTKIKTNKKGVKILLAALSCLKFPMPSLEYSNGKFSFNAFHF